MNLIGKELKRDVKLSLRLEKELPDWLGKDISESIKGARVLSQIHVENKEEGTHYNWPEEVFADRLERAKDGINQYFDTQKMPV